MDLDSKDLTMIYLALSTQIMDCMDIMESKDYSEFQKQEAEFICDSSIEVLDKVYNSLNQEDSNPNQPISRPKWGNNNQ